MSAAEISGYVAAGLVFMTFYMKTMVPLRVIGICSNCAFITYGGLGALYPVLILHLILLPLNSLRLREMLQLTKQVREAAYGDPNMNWLKPFTSTRHVRAGEVVFHKGEVASDMFVVLSGHFRLVETGIEVVSPHVVGEFALLTPEHSRTQTLECVDAGIVLQISYGQIEQLFFQNPKFGFYFLQLITRRLLQNTARLETGSTIGQRAVTRQGSETTRGAHTVAGLSRPISGKAGWRLLKLKSARARPYLWRPARGSCPVFL